MPSTPFPSFALLLLAAALVLGVIVARKAWRRRSRQTLPDQQTPPTEQPQPDQAGSRLVWRPGDGGQP